MSSNRLGSISLSSCAHGAAVELEHAEGVAAGQQLVGRLVVVERDASAVSSLDAPVLAG